MKHVILEVAEGRATLTLDRPPLNVLNIETMEEMGAALTEASMIPDLRVLVIEGAGKAFSAGVDVGEHMGDTAKKMLDTFNGLIARLLDFPLPTVALAKGAALGGGMEILLACDMVLAVPRASFGQPEIKVGVYPPPASVLLPPMVGTRRASELILTGRILGAEEAKEYGIVNHVYTADEFDAKAEETIAGFLALSGTVLRRTVEVLRFGDRYLKVMEPVSEHYHERLMTTADAQEGLTAFLEKRAPRWQHGV